MDKTTGHTTTTIVVYEGKLVHPTLNLSSTVRVYVLTSAVVWQLCPS